MVVLMKPHQNILVYEILYLRKNIKPRDIIQNFDMKQENGASQETFIFFYQMICVCDNPDANEQN